MNLNSEFKKTFSSNGLEITLTKDFTDITESLQDVYAAAFETDTMVIFALKEPFSGLTDYKDLTVEKYMDLVSKANVQQNKIYKKCPCLGDNCLVYDYYNDNDGQFYINISYFFESKDSFWIIQFMTIPSDALIYFEKIKEFVGTIRLY